MRYLSVLLLCACGLPMTSDEACDLVVEAVCRRTNQCASGSLDVCMATGRLNCEGYVRSERAVADCVAEINAEACPSLLQGSLPYLCFEANLQK